MKVGVPRERRQGERRVAAVPSTVNRLVHFGCEVLVETGAGAGAHASDESYREAGARITQRDQVLSAELVLCVRLPEDLPGPCTVVGLLEPWLNRPQPGVTLLALELLPRISRAQSVDALSSQASVAGYRAGLLAAEACPRFFPLMMTAAGTLRPATVLVLGAGVAGLGALATCRRLGAVVEAFDLRAAAREEVESLGGRFLDLGLRQEGGVYASALTDEERKAQRERLAEELPRFDAVITTAAVPGRPAPELLTAEMVTRLRPGSVVVDLAGNCALTRPGERLVTGGVTVIGATELPSEMAEAASFLYASNLANLVEQMVREGELQVDFEDELFAAMRVS